MVIRYIVDGGWQRYIKRVSNSNSGSEVGGYDTQAPFFTQETPDLFWKNYIYLTIFSGVNNDMDPLLTKHIALPLYDVCVSLGGTERKNK